jgi:hypothetical protein
VATAAGVDGTGAGRVDVAAGLPFAGACAASRTSSDREGRALVNMTRCSSAM